MEGGSFVKVWRGLRFEGVKDRGSVRSVFAFINFR